MAATEASALPDRAAAASRDRHVAAMTSVERSSSTCKRAPCHVPAAAASEARGQTSVVYADSPAEDTRWGTRADIHAAGLDRNRMTCHYADSRCHHSNDHPHLPPVLR